MPVVGERAETDGVVPAGDQYGDQERSPPDSGGHHRAGRPAAARGPDQQPHSHDRDDQDRVEPKEHGRAEGGSGREEPAESGSAVPRPAGHRHHAEQQHRGGRHRVEGQVRIDEVDAGEGEQQRCCQSRTSRHGEHAHEPQVGQHTDGACHGAEERGEEGHQPGTGLAVDDGVEHGHREVEQDHAESVRRVSPAVGAPGRPAARDHGGVDGEVALRHEAAGRRQRVLHVVGLQVAVRQQQVGAEHEQEQPGRLGPVAAATRAPLGTRLDAPVDLRKHSRRLRDRRG